MNNDKIKQATEQILTEMLTESTGKHFMDSGDAYGRHWEENQQNGVKKGYQICDFYRNDEKQTCELLPVVPIFDVLSHYLRYTDECKYLESLLPKDTYGQIPLFWIEEEIKNNNKNFMENKYIGSSVCNTYNNENFLSQEYMYIYFEYDGDPYIAISIHNGCDIRGGYTNVHIFNVGCEDEFLSAHTDASIDCLHTDGKIHICESGYQIYGYGDKYYSYLEQGDVDQHYVYEHTYVDENKQLRCKECNGLIVCTALQY